MLGGLASHVADKIEVADCWEWQGRLDRDGYGRTKVAGTDWGAHRYVWSTLVGPIPDGMQTDHLCRNRRCCNPDHLEVVDAATNTRRGYSVAALNARKTHCPRGHLLDGRLRNGRYCRTCKRAAYNEWAGRNKERIAARMAAYYQTRKAAC